MTTMTRTLRLLIVAAAALALMAPAAQARPTGLPATVVHLPTVTQGQTHMATPVVASEASGSGFNWMDASIGAAFTIVLIGVGMSGARIRHGRTAAV